MAGQSSEHPLSGGDQGQIQLPAGAVFVRHADDEPLRIARGDRREWEHVAFDGIGLQPGQLFSAKLPCVFQGDAGVQIAMRPRMGILIPPVVVKQIVQDGAARSFPIVEAQLFTNEIADVGDRSDIIQPVYL